MHSRKKLYETLKALAEKGEIAINLPESAKKMSNETYGKDSMIYLSWKSHEARRAGEAKLSRLGFKVCPDYSPGSATSEVQVAYFKGWHWDE